MLGAPRVVWYRPRAVSAASGPSNPPSGLNNTSSTTSSITMGWTNGDSSAETELYRDDVLVTTLAAGVNTYTDTGRSVNTSHAYKIRHKKDGLFSAYNGNFTFYSLPNAPTSPSATADSETQITLLWTDAHSLPVNVYRAGVYQAQVAAGTETYVDTGLTGGTNYAYTLRHVNSGWESADSTGVNATTDSASGPSGPPTSLVVEANGLRTFGLSWTNGDATAETEVYRDDVLVTTLAATVASYDDGLRAQGTSYTYKLRHKKNSQYSSYTADNTKTYPTVTGLAISGNDATDVFVHTWTAASGDLPSGWYLSLFTNDDVANVAGVTQNVGQGTTYNLDVTVFNYDIDPGGDVTVTADAALTLYSATNVALATNGMSPQAVLVFYNP